MAARKINDIWSNILQKRDCHVNDEDIEGDISQVIFLSVLPDHSYRCISPYIGGEVQRNPKIKISRTANHAEPGYHVQGGCAPHPQDSFRKYANNLTGGLLDIIGIYREKSRIHEITVAKHLAVPPEYKFYNKIFSYEKKVNNSKLVCKGGAEFLPKTG